MTKLRMGQWQTAWLRGSYLSQNDAERVLELSVSIQVSNDSLSSQSCILHSQDAAVCGWRRMTLDDSPSNQHTRGCVPWKRAQHHNSGITAAQRA